MSPIQEEKDGLAVMHSLSADFLRSSKGSDLVRDFLEKADANEELLLRFLRGRKFKANYAWESLKRYGEVRFDLYPEIFPDFKPAKRPVHLNAFGVLKSCDKLGRRVMVFDATLWDVEEHSLEDLLRGGIETIEAVLLDEQSMTNGVIFIQQCAGVSWKHAKQYTLYEIRRLMNVYWFAYPLKIKGIYFLNVPSICRYVVTMAKPFLSKKLQERLEVSGNDCKQLQQLIHKDMLPKCIGGTLEFLDAIDLTMPYF